MLDELTSFFFGGGIVAGSKYVATWLDPALAALVGGLPLGIIASFFLDTEQAKRRYYAGFLYSIFILALTIFGIHLISIVFPDASMNSISVIALFIWAVMSFITIHVLILRPSPAPARTGRN